MAAGPHRPRSTAPDLDYWLRRCEGFRVDSPQGRVGFVEEVRYASRCDRPDVIAVRAGRLGRLLLIIPVGEVAEIPPGEELVVLHRSPRPSATESTQTRRRHVQPGGPGGAPTTEVESAGAGTTRIEAQREVEAVINRLRQRMRLRRRRGGEEERRPVVEESAEPSAEEQPAQEQAGEEPAAEEAPSERAAEAAPAEEPAAEEPPAEEQTTT
jgi:hypothetical protein